MTVTTCDAQGKPVAAEVSLAVLPADREDAEAVADRSLTTCFRSRDRAAQFETASSILFHYQPANRAIAVAGPEEDAPSVPRHIAPQQGIPVAKPAAKRRQAGKPDLRQAGDDNPFGDDSTVPVASVPSVPSAANPFGDESAEPPASAVPAPRQRKVRAAPEPEATVSQLPRPTWSGYWNPAIATGPDGRATISVTLPDDATNLTLAAQAITPDTRAGQVSQNLVLKKDLSAVIHLPPAFTDGDEVELPVVVQNQVLDRGTLEVALNVNVDGHSWNGKKIFEVKSRGRFETSFKTTIRQLQRPAQEGGCLPAQPTAVFTVTVKAGKESDVCRRSVPVGPYGAPCRVAATGLASGVATVTIAPSRRHWTAPTLRIAVSPSIRRSLLDMLAPL